MSVADRQILKSTNTSATFTLLNGDHQLILDNFATGNAWNLYLRTSSSGNWIDLNVSFTGNGVKKFQAIEGVEYKFEGGAVGATAFIVPVFGGISPKNIVQT